MKATFFHAVGAIIVTYGIAACAPSIVEPQPTVTPAATQAPAPVPAPQPAPVAPVREQFYDNYLDAPQTPGTWEYVAEPSETIAVFGIDRANPEFIIRCNRSTRQVGLARRTTAAGLRRMRITTETTQRDLMTGQVGTRMLVAAELTARDQLLDAMAITKGRFAVSVEGERTLYLPAWTEVTRVIEDCR